MYFTLTEIEFALCGFFCKGSCMQNIFNTHSVRDRVLRQQMFRKFLRRQIAKKDPQYTVDVVGGGGWLAPVNPQNRY